MTSTLRGLPAESVLHTPGPSAQVICGSGGREWRGGHCRRGGRGAGITAGSAAREEGRTEGARHVQGVLQPCGMPSRHLAETHRPAGRRVSSRAAAGRFLQPPTTPAHPPGSTARRRAARLLGIRGLMVQRRRWRSRGTAARSGRGAGGAGGCAVGGCTTGWRPNAQASNRACGGRKAREGRALHPSSLSNAHPPAPWG